MGLLRGEICDPRTLPCLRGKTRGTWSTPYYTLKRTTLTSLLYYNYSDSMYKVIQRGLRKVRVCCPKIDLPSYR
jgi:hypothetical protein